MTKQKLVVESKDELIAMRIALHDYINSFSDQFIAEANPASNLAVTVRLYNMCKNLENGMDINYDVNRKPLHRLSV